MGTKIQWTDETVNFWMGCNKVSPGCKFCYMERMQGKEKAKRIWRTGDSTFNKALRLKNPSMLFTCSMSDFFIKEADEWRTDAWDVIRKTPQHIWQILTKRPERILECLPADWGEGWKNVWLGTSIENQDYLHRASTLANIPAQIRFISAEPLIGEIDFKKDEHGKVFLENFHWCIIGGESGYENGPFGFRECKLEWIEKIIVDLENTQVKVFVKQVGTFLGKQMKMKDMHGGEIYKFPEHLKIREFPLGNLTEIFEESSVEVGII